METELLDKHDIEMRLVFETRRNLDPFHPIYYDFDYTKSIQLCKPNEL